MFDTFLPIPDAESLPIKASCVNLCMKIMQEALEHQANDAALVAIC